MENNLLWTDKERLQVLDTVHRLRSENERLRTAIAWIEPPFVDENTPEAELRQRIKFLLADANRAALAQGGDA